MFIVDEELISISTEVSKANKTATIMYIKLIRSFLAVYSGKCKKKSVSNSDATL